MLRNVKTVVVCTCCLYQFCVAFRRKEGNVLFNDALNTFYLREGRKEIFYLTMHSTHFIYGYMASRHMVKDH